MMTGLNYTSIPYPHPFGVRTGHTEEKIQIIHSMITNIRKDALHKASTEISKNHAMIVLEKLGVSRMSKSAKGNSEKHGKNVKAKAGLNKSIRDAGWSMFAQMLEYKQLWSGGNVEYVPAAYTSQCCSKCQHTAKENRVSQSKFKCVECSYEANAESLARGCAECTLIGYYNAALNILARWRQDIAVSACGVSVLSDSVKQEPLAV